MNNDPKKGWVFLSVNKRIGFILLALLEEKIHSQKFNKGTRSDLNVVRVMLMNILKCEFIFEDSEEP